MADDNRQLSYRPYRPRAAAERHRAAMQAALESVPSAEQACHGPSGSDSQQSPHRPAPKQPAGAAAA
ncbi:MAG: hypothetical protein AB7O43_03360 [Hyphomicrobiaceae bacterium]